MDITWFGRSCFRLASSQATVLTDPFGTLPAAALNGVDFVTVSDRSRRGELAEIPGARVVDGPGEYEIKGVPVTGVAVLLGDADDGAKRRTFVYSFTLDGIAVCHLGGITGSGGSVRVQEIGQPDALLIPLGEPQGLPAARAVQIASQLEAKLLVPMTLGGTNDSGAIESFCKELGADPNLVESKISVSATAVAAQTRVALLAPQGGA
jgi:L-ascorbate metabolism protein UlaG (beta-lactamase superfamily)